MFCSAHQSSAYNNQIVSKVAKKGSGQDATSMTARKMSGNPGGITT
jgi:hypothetical protein